MQKGELAALRRKVEVLEMISEARKAALVSALNGDSDWAHKADLAVRAVREGRTPSGGRLVEVAIGTPLACDPTSETYWSM